MDAAFLARGKERFRITCSPCHGESGNGAGIVSKYWMIPPTANLIDPRVKAMPEGQIFWTITHGKGLMGPYNGVLSVNDRWAITAYLRGLQAASGN
jgi:mono/diheme cytochrome c family protein